MKQIVFSCSHSRHTQLRLKRSYVSNGNKILFKSKNYPRNDNQWHTKKTHTGKKIVSNNFRFSFQVTNLWRMDSMMVAHKIFHIQYCALFNSVWIISFFFLRCSLWSSTKWHTTIHCGCRRRCCYFFSELMIFFLSCLCLHCTPLQSHWLSFSLSLFHARYTSQHSTEL